jgi:hypothetical protein
MSHNSSQIHSRQRQALELIVSRLAPEEQLPWLLSGSLSQELQGVQAPKTSELTLLTGEAEISRIATLLQAEELAPLETRALGHYGPSLAGSYRLSLGDGTTIDVHLIANAQIKVKQATLSLALERIWPLRIASTIAEQRIALVPLEAELMSALLRDQPKEAHAIATLLWSRGVQVDRLEPLLLQVPELEEQLWTLFEDVKPMAKRAAGKRQRRRLGWGGQRK